MWLVPCRRQAAPLTYTVVPRITREGCSSPSSECLLALPVYFKSTIAGNVDISRKSHGFWTSVPKRLGRSRKAD